MVLERDVADSWARAWVAKQKSDYWLRIPDSSDGIKPFDGVLFREINPGTHVAIAVEFKVWRLKRKKFDYSTVEPHQMRALLNFRNGKGRSALILVYYEHEKKWVAYKPSEAKLKELIEKRRAPGGIRRSQEPKENA